MILNGFAEFIRNLLICKDERVIGLLEVVETFKKRFAETAKKVDTGYLISALNILSEAEIAYKGARNKRLHVELALIKLCYLQQALQLATEGGQLGKKKIVDEARAVSFKAIQPLVLKGPEPKTKPAAAPKPADEPKLIIETPAPKPAAVVREEKPTYSQPIVATAPVTNNVAVKEAPAKGKAKLSSLDAIRQKVQQEACGTAIVADVPLEQGTLQVAWQQFIQGLREAKNPAVQSFELAQLIIKDANSFEATATNNIAQKFLEFERNKACEFLQKELCNKQLQFFIVLIDAPGEEIQYERPLSSKEQYQRIIEEFPLVKELRERLRLDLDF
jgi:DNA polymerase III subunit gamma/tau